MFDKSKPTIGSELLEGVVEIRGDNGAHYKAYIRDINDCNDSPSITLKFHNDWHQIQTFAINRIRLPPTNRNEDIYDNCLNDCQSSADQRMTQQFVEGMDVEVFSKGSDCKEYGFWVANIKMINGLDFNKYLLFQFFYFFVHFFRNVFLKFNFTAILSHSRIKKNLTLSEIFLFFHQLFYVLKLIFSFFLHFFEHNFNSNFH